MAHIKVRKIVAVWFLESDWKEQVSLSEPGPKLWTTSIIATLLLSVYMLNFVKVHLRKGFHNLKKKKDYKEDSKTKATFIFP